jgi:UDP-glucose-4-epimerase GalE
VRVLLTGGAGYIGSHTARLIHDAGHDVVVLDRVDAAGLTAIVPIEVIRGDVRDETLVREVFADRAIDAVIHLAGHKSVERSLVDPGEYFSNNVGGSLVLFRAMAAAGVRSIVFSSSCAIYGPDNEPPLTERASIDPQTPYGESKWLVERMLRWFEQAHGFRIVSLRYFNAAGAAPDGRTGEDWTMATNLVPMVMKAAAGLVDALTIFGTDYPTHDGTAVRDYIHVMDLARAHLCALEYLDAGGTSAALNLGTGHGATVLEVVEAARRASGRPIAVRFADRRPGDLAAVWADASRAANVLEWQARLGLDEIVGSAWRWNAGQLARVPQK